MYISLRLPQINPSSNLYIPQANHYILLSLYLHLNWSPSIFKRMQLFFFLFLIQADAIFCMDKPSTFILMLALLPTFASLLLMSFVLIYKASKREALECFPCSCGRIFFIIFFLPRLWLNLFWFRLRFGHVIFWKNFFLSFFSLYIFLYRNSPMNSEINMFFPLIFE